MFNKIYEKSKKFIVENYKFLLVLLTIILVFEVELPYIIYKPGGSINLNERVEVEDGYETKGSFEMAYVSVVKGSLPFLAIAKILPNWDIAPKSEIAEDDESVQDALERDKIYLKEAMNNATMVAYALANKKIEIKETYNNIIYITDDADTTLKLYDQILDVDGGKVSSLDDLKEMVAKKQEGDVLNFKVLRNDKVKEATAKVYNTEDGLKAGVSIINTYDLETFPQINIKSKSSESGPSGGLMTALSIYNFLVEEDLTKGRKIVGTGTISTNGVVGEIGGVKYKLMGAAKNDADIFLCPKENYDEAMKVVEEKNYNITIVAVANIKDAINYLINN